MSSPGRGLVLVAVDLGRRGAGDSQASARTVGEIILSYTVGLSGS
jgi:hypothetical protein